MPAAPHLRVAGLDRPLAAFLVIEFGLASAGHHRAHQLCEVHGVACRVVDPAGAEHAVFRGADEGRLAAVEGCLAVGQGNLQRHHAVAVRFVAVQQKRLDADLAGRVVEAERRHPSE